MDKLWAPWRMKYISTIDQEDEGCIFCTKPAEDKDAQNLILHRASDCFVVMNLYPYNNGHLLIVPYKHTNTLAGLSPQEKTDLFEVVEKSIDVLKKTLSPDGFNVGMNLGRVAGAGIDQHLHIHIVPRWNGDTNFMPVLDNTKVISESLEDCYNRLRKIFCENI